MRSILFILAALTVVVLGCAPCGTTKPKKNIQHNDHVQDREGVAYASTKYSETANQKA